ncbi:unnamed protein product [Larinioides sclopetarius]|uniref:Cell division protein n=1 Tax=Larinioides sclopetarius TaxID=280406 RepID=A0AAV2AB67_9ARAC
MHYEDPFHESEYDEELIEDSDEMLHDTSYGIETHDDYSTHHSSNRDGQNDEKYIGEIRDYQHFKNNHAIVLDGKVIEIKSEHVPHEDESIEHIAKAKNVENFNPNEEHLMKSEHVVSYRRKIETDDKQFPNQRGANKHLIHIEHDENNDDEHHIFSGEKYIEAYEKPFSDQLATLKRTTESVHDENSFSTYSLISGGRKFGAHKNHFFNQHGTDKPTIQSAHDKSKEGNEEYLNNFEHDVVVGVIEAHEELVPRPDRNSEYTTPMMHIAFFDESKKYLDKIQNSAFPVKSNIQIHGRRIINQDSKERSVLKIEHNEDLNTNEEQFFNKRGHSIIFGRNKTEMPHLLIVEIKDLKNAKPLEHTDDNEGNTNYHEVVLDRNGKETRNKHAITFDLIRGDSKENTKEEDFDKEGEHLRMHLHNTTAFEKTENLKKSEPVEFSIESKDSTNGSEHLSIAKSKQNINEKNYNFSHDPIRSEPDYFEFYDYYDLLSQVAAFKVKNHQLKRTYTTESPSVNVDKKSLNMKEEITLPRTTSTLFVPNSLSSISHSTTKYSRIDLTSKLYRNTFNTEKTTQRAKIHSVTPQSYNSNYPKETHLKKLKSLFRENLGNGEIKYDPLLTISSQSPSTSLSSISQSPIESARPRTHQSTLYQRVGHQNNVYRSKTTKSFKISTENFTIKYASNEYFKKKFETAPTTDFKHSVRYKTRVTSPMSIATEFSSSNSLSIRSQDDSEPSRILHLLPYLHLHQIKTTSKIEIQSTFPPLSTLKPMLDYVIMCKTINATKFDSQPLLFRRLSNPVHKFSFIQRKGFSQGKKNKFASTPHPLSTKVQKVEIGPRDYTVCDYHHYTTKRYLYKPRNLNKSLFRHISTPFEISSNDYAYSGGRLIGTFAPKFYSKQKNLPNSENIRGRNFNNYFRRNVGIHLHNQSKLLTKNYFSPRTNAYEYVITPRTSKPKSKQPFTQATITLTTSNRKQKAVMGKLSGPISVFATRNFKSTSHKNSFYKVSTKETYKMFTEKPIKHIPPNYSNRSALLSSTQHEDHETKSSKVFDIINKKFLENKKKENYAQTSIKHTFPRTRGPINISTTYSITNISAYFPISYSKTLDKIKRDSFSTKHYILGIMTKPVKTSTFRPSSIDTKDSSILEVTYPSYSQKQNITQIAEKKELTSPNDKPITYVPDTVITRRNQVLRKTISNHSQTTALFYPSRRTKNIEEKADSLSYTSKQSIRKITLEPKEYITQNKVITLFPYSVTTKRNQELQKSSAHYLDTLVPYSSTSKTKDTIGHVTFPSYSTERNNYRISQESDGFISFNKPISYSFSVYEAKKRTKNKDKTATFSQQEPLANAQKYGIITTSTESTNLNANIYSTEDYTSISDKKHESLINEEQLEASKDYQQITPSVYQSPIEEQGSHLISMKYKPFIIYNSITPEKLHPTSILPLLIKTLHADKKKYSQNASSYETTTNARMETHIYNFKHKHLSLNSVETKSNYFSTTAPPFSTEPTIQTVNENKFYYQTSIQRNTTSSKQLATIYSLHKTAASSYTRDYKTANIVTSDEYSHSINQKPTMLMTPSAMKPFDYNSRISHHSTVHEFKRGKTKDILPILRYQPLITQKPPEMFVSIPSTSTLAHRFKNRPTTIDDHNKETNMLLSPRVPVKDNILPLSDLMLYWLCYRSMHLDKNKQNCTFNQRHTYQTMNSVSKTMKPSVITTSMHLTSNMTNKGFSQTTTRSNYLRTTTLLYPPRTKNIKAKLIYPSYSTEQIIPRNIVESVESTSHNKPPTLFSHIVTAKRNQGLRQSTAHYFTTLLPFTAKSSKLSIVYTPISKDILKLPKYPSVIIRNQQHGYLATKPLDKLRVLHSTVDTTDPFTEYSLKSDETHRYTKKTSENFLSTEPESRNRPNRKSPDNLRYFIPNTSPSSIPETVLEKPEFSKIALSKEVTAFEKFSYFSTKLPLYLRLKETIRRKSSEVESRRASVKRFTANMPEFIAKNQNKTVPTEQSAPELNATQQSGGYLGRRRGRPGGRRGRPGRGGGRRGSKTPARVVGRPTKTKD